MSLILPSHYVRRREDSTERTVGIFLPVTAAFPDATADERSLVNALQTLRREDVLFKCAKINRLVSGHGWERSWDRQMAEVASSCLPGQIDRINEFARQWRVAGRPTAFFRGQMLELMRWAALHCDKRPSDGTSLEDPEARNRFFKAALIASDVWGKRVYGDRLKDSSGAVSEARMRALPAFHRAMEEANPSPHLGPMIGRGFSLYADYLRRFHPDFDADFHAATGMEFGDYMACALALASYTFATFDGDGVFNANTVASATANREEFDRFLELESRRPEELERALWEGFDRTGYLGLRRRPIMVASDGRAVILDPKIFYEKLTASPLFYARDTARLKGGDGAVQELFGKFGNAFEACERDRFDRMYPPPAVEGMARRVLFGEEGRDAKGDEFEIDAFMVEPNVVDGGSTTTYAVVFEIKGVWLRDDKILSDIDEVYIEEIRRKYGEAQGDSKRRKRGQAKERGRGVGVVQLARSVGAIMREEWLGNHGEFVGATAFFPVLLVHDARLDTPCLAAFLNEDFLRLLGAIPAGKSVRPLVVLTMQDHENLESSLGRRTLLGLLNAYDAACPDRA